jgi:hypothetical protein
MPYKRITIKEATTIAHCVYDFSRKLNSGIFQNSLKYVGIV